MGTTSRRWRKHLVVASWVAVIAVAILLAVLVPSGSLLAWVLIAIGGVSGVIDLIKTPPGALPRPRLRRHRLAV